MPRLSLILLSSLSLITAQGFAYTDQPSEQELTSNGPYESFTGKITRNRVRLRLQPSLDSVILKEFDKGDLIIVTGENEDFYAVNPPEEVKGYVFRTYILDNVVEGTHVNIRLQPDTEAPIVGQLNKGDHIQGEISPLNSKWIEISLPNETKLYVCKDYVEKIGDSNAMQALKQRRDEVNELLTKSYETAQSELGKPFEEININPILAGYDKVITKYADFTEQAARAKELQTQAQETYLQKKLAHLESKANSSTQKLQAQQDKLQKLESELSKVKPAVQKAPVDQAAFKEKVKEWIAAEEYLYHEWAKEHSSGSVEEYEQYQKGESVILTGVIEPYVRSVKNKPGDYLLVARNSRLPMAYLYSTTVDLSTLVGHEVTLIAAPRPNNSFAHPAYYVISYE